MTSKASVIPAVRAHFDTLRDDRTGKVRRVDYVLFVGLPVTAASAAWYFDFRMKDMASALAGLAVFTALLFGLVIFVFQLRIQIKNDGREREHPRLVRLVDETFSNVTYSVVIGLATTVVGMIAASVAEKEVGAPVWITVILVLLGTHLVLTILMCLKRIHSAYQQIKF